MGVAVLTVLTQDHVTPDIERESALNLPPTPSHPWVLVAGKYWEIDSGQSEDPSVTDAGEGTRGSCSPGMVEVQGFMKTDGDRGSVEFLQDIACTDWIDRHFPERCARFDEQKWLQLARELLVKPLHFCIDRYEYPNRKGAYPVIAVTWHEAGQACRERGERLCTEDEWTFACEGEQALPYPNGYTRDGKACVLDKAWRLFDAYRLAVRDSTLAVSEIDYAWQGEPSGARPGCRSPFGVYDTTGNVDEWTQSVRHGGYASILKGGYWGPVRARCRASTRAHNEDFYFYQQGFRCCSDPPPPASVQVAGP